MSIISWFKFKLSKQPAYGPESYRQMITGYQLSEDEIDYLEALSEEFRISDLERWRIPNSWNIQVIAPYSIIVYSEEHNCRIAIMHNDFIVITRLDSPRSERGIYLKLDRQPKFVNSLATFTMLNFDQKDIKTISRFLVKLIRKTDSKKNVVA